MWIKLDFSNTSPWFLIGMLVRLYWAETTVLLVANVLFAIIFKGWARALLLAIAVAAIVFVLVGLAVFFDT